VDLLSTISVGSGMAWASGMRLYAVVFAAGLLQRFNFVKLPGDLSVLTNPWIMGLSGLLLVVEFLADKVPLIDSAWDTVHTFIRIPAGAILAACAIGHEASPAMIIGATLVGGAITGTTHVSKASTRAAINTSPEPVSNITASLAEDGMVGVGFAGMLATPVLFLFALVVFLCVASVLIWFLWKFVRAVLRRIFGPKSATPEGGQEALASSIASEAAPGANADAPLR
jgi:hypothetical protein